MSLALSSPNSTGLASDPKSQLQSLLRTFGTPLAVTDQEPQRSIEISAKRQRSLLVQSIPRAASFEEKIFDALVSLKVAVSQYAMHMPAAERGRLFARLDQIINVEDWHEEDTLPLLRSFINFLKWVIFSKNFQWSSIGVSDEGNIQVAWIIPKVSITANFSIENKVTWTASIESESGVAHVVGTGTLQHFAKHAEFYLSGGAAA